MPSHKHARTPDHDAHLEDLADVESLERSEDSTDYGEYDDYLADDVEFTQRVRGRSLLSEHEQKAEKRLLRRGRLTDRERERLAERREEALHARGLPEGADRWSTWGEGELGPEPRPDWLVVADGAVDSRLGVVKTGKEADVHLIERWVPGFDSAPSASARHGSAQAGSAQAGSAQLESTQAGSAARSVFVRRPSDQQASVRRASVPQASERSADDARSADEADLTPAASCLLAEKIYRGNDHRNFHRDAGYLDGRRTRESRLDRAVANRTGFGLKVIAEQWAVAEFAALSLLWAAGAPVPYPVQRVGTELLLEFVGDADGAAAPRLAALRPEPDELADLWGQLCAALAHVARAGYTHGDLSPYNILVHEGRLVLIDLPQIVDLAVNPRGGEYLRRDVDNVSSWFAARGLPDVERRSADLLTELSYEARLL